MTINLQSATGLGSIAPRIIGATLGTPYQQYRASGGTVAALASANLINSALPAWLTTDPALMGNMPPQDGKPVWYGGFDPNLTQPGDYLVGNFGTFFIASQTLPMPISLRSCNVVLTHFQPAPPVPGSTYRSDATLPSIMAANAWPGWKLTSERRSGPELKNPGEVQLPSAKILLPATMPAEILRDDDLVENDGAGTRWTVQSADLTPTGWSIIAIQAAS